jgi:hypothetical protein
LTRQRRQDCRRLCKDPIAKAGFQIVATNQGEIMAVRKSVEDTVVVFGLRDRWLLACEDALESQGFTKIDVSGTLFQIRANYKKATVWGDLEITLVPEGTGATKINAKATANVDNVFAAFGSPGRKIIDRFKQGIAGTTVDTALPLPQPSTETERPASVADQIRQLGELRDQGLVTPDEFESKKAELLQRM